MYFSSEQLHINQQRKEQQKVTQSETYKNALDLIYLVSCAVNNYCPDAQRCAEMDDDAVYRLASMHMLSAAAAGALEKIMPLPQHWISAKGNAKRRLIIYQAERTGIFNAFDERGIWYLPLKGIVLKDAYPEASMREMSDNDILCDATKMAEIKAVMKSMGFTCVEYGNLHHDVYHKKPVCFEIHSNLFNKVEHPELYAYYKTLAKRLIKDNNNRCGYHMTDEDFYIYCINHMYKHFSNAGTGLRSLLDIYVINKAKGQTLDREYIAGELDLLGTREYESKTRQLAEKIFSLKPLTDSDKDDLSVYIYSGVYGTKEQMIAKRLGNDSSKKNKRRYILRRIFPDKRDVELYYPAVHRHKVLYPLLVVYRPFRGLVKHRKNLVEEFKSVRKYNQPGDTDKK